MFYTCIETSDLSSSITVNENAGLTYKIKKAYKVGNIVTLTIAATNSSGADIAANTQLFSLASGMYNPTTNLEFPYFRYGSTSIMTMSQYGSVWSRSAIANGNDIVLAVSYAVA